MFQYFNVISKFIYSLILLSLALYYFALGTNSISNLIKVNNNQIKNKTTKIQEKKIEKIEREAAIIADNQEKAENKVENIDETFLIKPDVEIEPIPKKTTKIEIIKVKKNDTFSLILNNQKIEKKYIQKIINTAENLINLKKLRIGQEIIFNYSYDENESILLEKILIPLSFKDEVTIKKIGEKFIGKVIALPIISEKKFINVNIKESIYKSGKESDVPNSVLMDLIRLYSFDVDFQRDIRVDDSYKVYYEIFSNEKRREIAFGDILYSNLILQGKEIEYFLFETKDGFDYFNRQGKNARKALMKTPLDGARLSSGYGMRKHPILGYDLMHKGLDFAAPKGTPVFAAGNGTIEYAGRNGSYGKYIRIRHNNSYKTAYAHLNGYNKGIGKGVRVKQGEIIGYVGSTGRSTGPHLHYEVIFNGEKINPMKMKLPSGKTLKNEELDNFVQHSSQIYSEILKKSNYEYQ